MLTCDSLCGDMVDPDQVSASQGNGITTPDVMRVDIGDRDILAFC